MRRKEPVITQDEMIAAAEEARRDFGAPGEYRPAGARSITEWAKLVGIGDTTMRIRMRKKVAEGQYERVTARIMSPAGVVLPVPMYRKVKQASSAKLDRI